VPLVGATGFYGGAMVYGIHEYDWNPPHEASSGGGGGNASAPGHTQPGEAGVVTVLMNDQAAFAPASVTIPAGTKVRWKNGSREDHTVTNDPKVAENAKDVSMPTDAKPFNSGNIKPGGTFEQMFTVPGTYRYVCQPHEGMDMKGQVIVTPTQK
jgi:plastocyanin